MYELDVLKTEKAMKKAGSAYVPPSNIRIVKSSQSNVVSRRRDVLLKNLDYMEAQIGRLANMAREMRAEVLSLTTE